MDNTFISTDYLITHNRVLAFESIQILNDDDDFNSLGFQKDNPRTLTSTRRFSGIIPRKVKSLEQFEEHRHSCIIMMIIRRAKLQPQVPKG